MVVLKTNHGDITLELDAENAPATVARLEPCFHPDSYGYRPHKSAHDALKEIGRASCRERVCYPV